jgi:hypothetical protein
MVPDVVVIDLGEYPPVLQPPVQHLVTCPDATLHLEVLNRVNIILGTLDLVHVSAIAVISLDTFAWLEEVHEAGGEDLDVGPCTGGVRALYPDEIPHQDVHPQLIAEGGLPHILVQPKRVALPCSSLLRDAKVHPIHQHKAVVANVVDAKMALKVNLWFG